MNGWMSYCQKKGLCPECVKGLCVCSKGVENESGSEQEHTNQDAYGTLQHHGHEFGIEDVPDASTFSNKLASAPVVHLSPEHVVGLENTSAHRGMIGRGINDPSVVEGTGMEDQRHDSWQSVVHHASKPQTAPVVAVRHRGRTVLLDGDHRAVAGVLINRPVMAKIVDL